MRGRKVPPRRPSVLCDGHLSPSTMVVCDHPAALRSIRCWVVPGRDSSSSAGSVRRVPSLPSAVSLRLGYTWPLFLHTSAGVNPAGSVPGVQEAAVPAQGGEAVCLPFRSGLFLSAVKPASGLADAPFQSPAALTHQTASTPTLHFVPHPMALPVS